MKKIRRFFYLIFAVIFAVSAFNTEIEIASFFSSAAEAVIGGETGSVDVAVDNLKLEGNQIMSASTDASLNDGILEINTSETFSFTVKNNGKSAVNYRLDIEISWDAELSEAGKILIYPQSLSDETIYENLQNNNYSGAVVSAEVSDENVIQTSAGLSYGISEVIDRAELDSAFHSSGKAVSKDYVFKLFFYGDEEIVSGPALFENEFLEVNIIVYADIIQRQTGWELKTQQHFRTVALINATVPVIKEVSRQKTFFVAQTDTLDISSYAIAYDENDGDITSKIKITSSPAFNPDKAGVYKITYNVKNKMNFPAAPLQVTIVIWDFVKIVSGNYHTLALTSHGNVYAWGRNTEGQLGDGSSRNRTAPQLIASLSNITDIAACYSSSYALTDDGRIYAWGHNGYGHLGDGTTNAKNRPVEVKRPDGVIFTQLSARFNTAGAVTAEGDVYTWGYGGYGTAGTGSSVDINTVPQKINLSNIAKLEFGNYNGAALTEDGKLYLWGVNWYGLLGNGEIDSNDKAYAPAVMPYFDRENIKIEQVSVGTLHMIAISKDGRLFTWGSGGQGVLGNGLTSDEFTPQHIILPATPVQAVAGVSHSGVLTADGNVYLFGDNSFGKLGTGDTAELLLPTLLKGVSNATYLAFGTDSTFVLSEGRMLYGMGVGKYGALGNGDTADSFVPSKWAFTV